ncbi:MAG: hypothetical protein JWP08_131 [Bryobacterales bacterium]|nr:hypothetical protein [Bryobacterales bacterium]
MSLQTVPFLEDGVVGHLHRPEGSARAGLVLTHGAGANCDSPLLRRMAGALAVRDFAVLRCDLPFRQRRRTGPPFPAQAATDREGLRVAVAAMRQLFDAPMFLGGHSYGGRQASMLASEQPRLVKGLLLLSYPLHPPAKPHQLRTGHFGSLRSPALFVHGTRDPFGSVEEIQEAIELIPARTLVKRLEGAGHDLRGGSFPAEEVAELFLNLLD